jgi:hypothetical protein
MASSISPQNNGLDTDSMPPPNVLFPGSQHDAQVEWTMAQRVFIPAVRYLFMGFVALILFGVTNGFIVGPWKGEIDKAAADRKTAIAELSVNQSNIAKIVDQHDVILSRIEETMRRVELSVAKIEGRIAPLAPDLAANAPAPAAPPFRAYAVPARPKLKPSESHLTH